MVGSRRFFPLIALVGLGVVGLIARLYQVQIVEHEVWASEAANLTRSGRTLPYLRGKITDRNGEVFVQDEEAYAVRFVYREFRRHHPLGQVAHARGALERRSVSLQEAAGSLETWGMQLVDLQAGELQRFADYGAAELCGLAFEEVERGAEQRRTRANEVRFYIQGLLQARRADWRDILKSIKNEEGLDRTFAQLVADKEEVSVQEVRERTERRLSRSLGRLRQLAMQMEVLGPDGTPALSGDEFLGHLVNALEDKRRGIEDAIARDLFLEATGFEPGRVESELLLALVDLEFLAARLGWSEARERDWAERARETWLANRRTFHVPRAQISARLREDRGEGAYDAWFGELARLFARRPRTPREARAQQREWHRIDAAAVFAELPDLFERIELEGELTRLLPFLDEAVREGRAEGWHAQQLEAFLPFEYAAEVALANPPEPYVDWRGREWDPWRAPESVEAARERIAWRLQPPRNLDTTHLADPSAPRDAEELLPWLAELWEARFQAELGGVLERVEAKALRAGFALPLELAEERVERAAKKYDYFVRDRGSRPERIDDTPDDAIVNTLTRFSSEYAGFEVEPRTRRLAMALDADGLLIARELIGVVRESTLEEVLEQQYERRAFDQIFRKREHSSEDTREMGALVRELYRQDEVHGSSGIEGLMDRELRGRNGFEVREGLQQRAERTRGVRVTEKVNGKDVELTLAVELQQAAQRTIERPFLPPSEARRDDYWFRNPVGAIVLARVNGEVLAAASAPKQPDDPSPARDGERGYNYDRTLRMPLFHPAGSIFKPFVAAYALSRRGLDPEHVYFCEPRPGGSAGWNKVGCHKRWGHGAMTLDVAIQESCNAYFAQVGELLETKENLTELAHMFGFDLPTGVRAVGGRGGLSEDFRIPRLRSSRELSLTELNRAGNGLEVIQVTPIQVARATAGLATGELPRMRLVRSVDGVPLPVETETIPLPAWALERVRQGMRGVVTKGSAKQKGLDDEDLGFAVAGKTGSADYLPMTAAYRSELSRGDGWEPEMRKHAWFTGFFPVDDPQFVVVIYCHDIGATASRTAVYVAAQFLATDEVQAFAQGAFK